MPITNTEFQVNAYTIIIDDNQFVIAIDNSNLPYPSLPSVSLQGDIQAAYSEDLYQIHLDADTTVVIDVDFLIGDTLPDSVVYLLDAGMNIVTFNDDGQSYNELDSEFTSYLEYTSLSDAIYYIAVSGYEAYDTGTYTLNISKDVNGTVATAQIDDTIVAHNDTAITAENTTIVIDILANDINVNNSILDISAISAANGAVTINTNGTINYTPNAGFLGVDVITYAISDIPQGNVTHSLEFTNPEAFGDYYSNIYNCIDAAIIEWEYLISSYYSVNIEINITGVDGSFLASATASSTYSTGTIDPDSDVYIGISGVQHEIQTGIDINSINHTDGYIDISINYLDEYWFDPTPYNLLDNSPAANQYDFRGLIMHEFGHILGFNGNLEYRPDTTNQLLNSYPNFISNYDSYIQWDENLNSFIFTGENAVSAYHELGFVGSLPLHSEGYAVGSDLYHYGLYTEDYASYLSDPLNDYLMTYSSAYGLVDTISTIDLGILTDLGYNSYSDTVTASVDVQVIEQNHEPQVNTIDGINLNNLSLLYFKDGIDTGISTLVEQGGIKIDTSIDFDSIRLSIDTAYQGDINIMDMYGALDNIGQVIDTYQEHAADTNNDGSINIIDMYSVLDSIGQTPQSFDLIDETGNLVTSLNANSIDIANWTIIANGDVDLSGSFGDGYVMADIV